MKHEEGVQDIEWMLRAIALGLQARRISPPNPWVGCVLVRDDNLVGEGCTQAAGGPHAEVMALRAAGENARGATAYVSLEPCCHYGRTPPCTQALIQAGISRVVVSVEDPDPRVHLRGMNELRAAGIAVTVGICKDVACKALGPYLHQRTTGRPWVIVKAALSIDGRMAAKDGSSHWITGEEARTNAHALRADSQAILVGAGTALADQPSLTVRYGVDPGIRPPLRVVLDSRGNVPPKGPLFNTSLAPTLIYTTSGASASRITEWKAVGVEVVALEAEKNGVGVQLESVLNDLGSRGVLQLLVEGGAKLSSALLASDLVNQLIVYQGPVLLGDEGLPFFQGHSPSTIKDATRYQPIHRVMLGSTLRTDYSPTEAN